jgi:ADP-dependent phosphofructokinase/glucokinase
MNTNNSANIGEQTKGRAAPTQASKAGKKVTPLVNAVISAIADADYIAYIFDFAQAETNNFDEELVKIEDSIAVVASDEQSNIIEILNCDDDVNMDYSEIIAEVADATIITSDVEILDSGTDDSDMYEAAMTCDMDSGTDDSDMYEVAMTYDMDSLIV